ncbi:glycosyltransferase family 2 protein [Rheinheimera baltica]|uniref:glycosyltransferase family 2 protein n=1 Tax=Rheinheimera baltica TaxID=67576 RepID=UPI00273D137C|nr:glycosyltransferase family 2 protein [Rheinheimera baltica]MDP5149784.1 glycosyltransferase family 2 protein [Rheinheimera baltica]
MITPPNVFSVMSVANRHMQRGEAHSAMQCWQQLVANPDTDPILSKHLCALMCQQHELTNSLIWQQRTRTEISDTEYNQQLGELKKYPAPNGLEAALERTANNAFQAIDWWLQQADMPLVSIIMPTFNRAAIMIRAINSVLEQWYPNWELLVCDDGSTDDTALQVNNIADKRIRYMSLPKRGAASARNEGLKQAKGQIFAYLDSDNLWHPAFLTQTVAALIQQDALSLYCDFIDFKVVPEGYWLRSFKRPEFSYENLKNKNFIDLNAFIHRRELYQLSGGFNPALLRRQDHALLLKYTRMGRPFYLNSVLVLYRRDERLNPITYRYQHDESCHAIIERSLSYYERHGCLQQIPFSALTIIADYNNSAHADLISCLQTVLSKHLQLKYYFFNGTELTEHAAPEHNFPLVSLPDLSNLAHAFSVEHSQSALLLLSNAFPAVSIALTSAYQNKQPLLAVVSDNHSTYVPLSLPLQLSNSDIVKTDWSVNLWQQQGAALCSYLHTITLDADLDAAHQLLPHLLLAQPPQPLLASISLHLTDWLNYMALQQFDSDRYLHDYSDLAAAGVDPVQHYLRHGQFEGRSAFKKNAAPISPSLIQTKRLASALFRGYSGYTIRKLKALAQSTDAAVQFLAGMALARWYFQQTNLPAVFDILNSLPIEVRSNAAYKHAILRLALRGNAAAISTFFSNGWTNVPQNWVLKCNLAVQQRNYAQWLEGLNTVYQQANLTTLVLNNESDQPLLQRLTAINVTSIGGPLVSVIVPMHNAANTIEMVLKSVCQQSWANLDIILVDDASTDDSVKMAEGIAKHDPRIRLISNKRNKGAYASRNIGFLAAKGQFVTVNDADDWAHPDKIALQVTELINVPMLQVSATHWVRMTGAGLLLGCWKLSQPVVEKNHSSAMFRCTALKQVGLWDPVRFAADNEMLQRIQCHFGNSAINWLLPDVPLALSLVRSDSLTQTSFSHVSTIDFGVRWLYRELSAYWHKNSKRVYFIPDSRPFPLPLSMQQAPLNHFQLLLIADFSVGAQPAAMCNWVETQLWQSTNAVAFLHWPNPDILSENHLDNYWLSLGKRYPVVWIDQGCQISVERCVLTAQAKKHQPDTMPVVTINQLLQVIDPQSLAVWSCTKTNELSVLFTEQGDFSQ